MSENPKLKANYKLIGALVAIVAGVGGSLGYINSDDFKAGYCEPEYQKVAPSPIPSPIVILEAK